MNKKLLDIYTDYLISQNQYATATGLSKILDGKISHDKITRFLNSGNFGSKELWQYVKPHIRRFEKENKGVLILDDTIEEKMHTDENEIICWNYSHAKGSFIKGVNIISCLARYGDNALPIAFEAIKKDVLFCDVETKKVKRKASITKNELFLSIIKQAVRNKVKFEYILADNWFGAKKNMECIHYELKKNFIFGMRSNRLARIKDTRGPYRQLNHLPINDGDSVQVFLKHMSFPVVLYKKIFKNEDNSTGVLYLVTNDLTIDTNQIYEVYQKRWRIEEYHKSIKQNASLSKSPTKVVCSQKNHIFSAIISFCKLELMKISTNLNHFALKYKLLVTANKQAFLELQKMKKKLCPD